MKAPITETIAASLRSGMAAAGLAAPLFARAADPVTLCFASVGGTYGTSIKTNFVTPFEQASGMKVDLSANATLAPLKIQVQSKNVQWDLADLGGGEFLAGVRDDLFEPSRHEHRRFAQRPRLRQAPFRHPAYDVFVGDGVRPAQDCGQRCAQDVDGILPIPSVIPGHAVSVA